MAQNGSCYAATTNQVEEPVEAMPEGPWQKPACSLAVAELAAKRLRCGVQIGVGPGIHLTRQAIVLSFRRRLNRPLALTAAAAAAFAPPPPASPHAWFRLRELALQEDMEPGLASRGALPAAPPLPRWLTRHSLSPCLKIQNHIYSMPSPAYKVPSVTKCQASSATNYMETSEVVDFDWENLGFGLVETDFMYVAKCGPDGNFSKGEVLPFGPIAVSPSAGVLNYGQGLFEGLKAYRKTDGSILLFRPEENAARMITGAERMCMPAPTVEQFVDAVKQTVLANKRWVPPTGKGSLYIRPLLMGSGAVLGLAPAPEYTFIIFVSPVGNYFKEGLSPINLIVEDKFHRASPGGTGGVKTIGNYASVLKAQKIAKSKGYSDVLYLDAVHDKYLEEVSSCNIFVVKDNVISTPAIKGTILPGITRKSIIEVAQSKGFKVEERLVSVDELLNADEVFCTGTAVVMSPVGSITYLGKRVEYGNQGVGVVSQQLYKSLTSLQMGLVEDFMDWTVQLN